MADEKQTTDAANVIDKPKIIEMTEDELMKKERAIQLGEVDELPDGTKISDFQKKMDEDQVRFDQIRSTPSKEHVELNKKIGIIQDENKDIAVHFSGGVASVLPTKEEQKEAKQNTGAAGVPDESDLPKDFPGYKKLLDAGIINNVDLEKFTYDDFIAAGLTDTEARKALDVLTASKK